MFSTDNEKAACTNCSYFKSSRTNKRFNGSGQNTDIGRRHKFMTIEERENVDTYILASFKNYDNYLRVFITMFVLLHLSEKRCFRRGEACPRNT